MVTNDLEQGHAAHLPHSSVDAATEQKNKCNPQTA